MIFNPYINSALILKKDGVCELLKGTLEVVHRVESGSAGGTYKNTGKEIL